MVEVMPPNSKGAATQTIAQLMPQEMNDKETIEGHHLA
jgi:hypothetical protein